jgi:hypothetical protein
MPWRVALHRPLQRTVGLDWLVEPFQKIAIGSRFDRYQCAIELRIISYASGVCFGASFGRHLHSPFQVPSSTITPRKAVVAIRAELT